MEELLCSTTSKAATKVRYVSLSLQTRDRAYTHHDGMPPVWLLAHIGVDIPQDRFPGLDVLLLLRRLGDGEAHAPACVEDDPAGPEAHAHEDDK